MKWNIWTRLAAYLGLGFGLWLLLYALYWQDRTEHGVFIGDALITWIGDVVMLQWVKSYQGLLGGAFTLVAGGFVLYTAMYQQRMIEAGRQRDDATKLKAALLATAGRFRRLYRLLLAQKYDEAQAIVPALDLAAGELAFHAPLIASWMQYLTVDIATDLDKYPPIDPMYDHVLSGRLPERQNVTRATANAALGFEFFRDTERLIGPDGTFAFRHGNLEHLRKRLAQVGQIEPSSLYLSEGMFK